MCYRAKHPSQERTSAGGVVRHRSLLAQRFTRWVSTQKFRRERAQDVSESYARAGELCAYLTVGRAIPTVNYDIAMQPSKWIRIRPLQVSDFTFVRRLAAKHRGFTVPPPYVLWLLKETNGRFCMVAEHAQFGRVAYLLSVPVTQPRGKNVLYIWQMASSKAGRRAGAVDVLLLQLRTLIRKMRIRYILFTMVPDSPEFRLIRRYAHSLFRNTPHPGQNLPPIVSRCEYEFTVAVR